MGCENATIAYRISQTTRNRCKFNIATVAGLPASGYLGAANESWHVGIPHLRNYVKPCKFNIATVAGPPASFPSTLPPRATWMTPSPWCPCPTVTSGWGCTSRTWRPLCRRAARWTRRRPCAPPASTWCRRVVSGLLTGTVMCGCLVLHVLEVVSLDVEAAVRAASVFHASLTVFGSFSVHRWWCPCCPVCCASSCAASTPAWTATRFQWNGS